MRTSNGERLHIAIFGNTNAGKSTLLNYITGQEMAIVSATHGTTTDPINKPMEIHGLGPVIFIDTAGINDSTDLSDKRISKSLGVLEKADIFLYVLSLEDDLKFIDQLKAKDKPIIFIAPKQDLEIGKEIRGKFKDLRPITINVNTDDRYKLFEEIKKVVNNDGPLTLTGKLVKKLTQ